MKIFCYLSFHISQNKKPGSILSLLKNILNFVFLLWNLTNIIALNNLRIQFTLKKKLQEQATVTTTEKKRQLMDNFPFYCLVFNYEGYHDTAQSLYRGSPQFVISEFVIPAISWFSFSYNFVNSPPFHDFQKKKIKKFSRKNSQFYKRLISIFCCCLLPQSKY